MRSTTASPTLRSISIPGATSCAASEPPAGSDQTGPTLERWGDPDSPYYEKAMIARAVENVIFFASVTYAFRYQESATSLIAPDGACLAHVPYGEAQLLVSDLDLTQATGFSAKRYNSALYPA